MKTLEKRKDSPKAPKGTISRRDILKASWTVPVVLAVAPPAAIAAGSGCPGQGSPSGPGACYRPGDPPQGSIDIDP